MNGHAKRKEAKMALIKETAKELYNTQGMNQTTIDEIAMKAQVSKVTLYKYFTSKEGLITAIIRDVYDDIISETEALTQSDLPFLDKLKAITGNRIQTTQVYQGDFLEALFMNLESQDYKHFQKRTKALMLSFFEDGKQQGYIHGSMATETLYAYNELFKSGLQSLVRNNPKLLQDRQTMTDLVHLYFHGLVQSNHE